MTQREFSQFVTQYEKLVFTICYQFVKDYHEAQNLSQETFLSAYRHIDSYQGDNYKPWIARIATNKAKDYLNSAYSRRVMLASSEEDSVEDIAVCGRRIFPNSRTKRTSKRRVPTPSSK